MSNADDDIFELLHEHKKHIAHSCKFYRPIAKMHKINVLEAATRYLASEMSKETFIVVLRINKHYGDALGKSKTRELIESVLQEIPSKGRTKEGYVRCQKNSL